MSLRFCNTCCEMKPVDDFTKYGSECSKCKGKRINKQKEKYYKNRVRCVCGLYTSEANPKWKHEKTNSHMNYMKYGTRNPDEYAYISRNGTPEQRFKIEYALMESEEEETKIAK